MRTSRNSTSSAILSSYNKSVLAGWYRVLLYHHIQFSGESRIVGVIKVIRSLTIFTFLNDLMTNDLNDRSFSYVRNQPFLLLYEIFENI